MSRLRTYARMANESDKVKQDRDVFASVYAEVARRSDGRCEVEQDGEGRCRRRAMDPHHLFKPRRSHHTADEIVHVCRPCHDRMEYPFKRGRLCYLGSIVSGEIRRFRFALRYAASKFAARSES